MRFAIWSVILAAVAVGVALFARHSTGYVVIVAAPYRVELSLNLLIFLILAGYIAFYALARMIATLAAIPERVRVYREERQRSRLRQALNDALQATREVLEVPAGGVKLEGRVGDVRIPSSEITFDIFKGSQFEPGFKTPLAQGVLTGDVVVVPEGNYHIVSNYGDTNAVVRSDIRVQTGKLTDVTDSH